MKEDKDLEKNNSKDKNKENNDLTAMKQNDSNEIFDTTELNYQGLVNFMKSIECMTACSNKIEMYEKTAAQFDELDGYKDSLERAKECRKSSAKTKELINKLTYKRAQEKKKTAKSLNDYRETAEMFRRIKGYQDSDELALECDRLKQQIEKKSSGKKLIKIAVAVLIIIVFVLGITTSHAKYYLANTYKFAGSYSSAIPIYKKLGAYKDSPKRLQESEYRYGMQLKEDKDYKNAQKAFGAAGDYKDSEKQKVEMEKLDITKSGIGKTVKIGSYKWEILEIKDGQALLMKKKALSGQPYHDTFENITWEKCSLRKWLNSNFLKETFTKEELNNILSAQIVNGDNPIYGTDGGKDTTDYTFLLSTKEVDKYQSLFPKFTSNSWLRTPGYNQCSAAFLSVKGSIMAYGYDITNKEITVRPAFWFNLK